MEDLLEFLSPLLESLVGFVIQVVCGILLALVCDLFGQPNFKRDRRILTLFTAPACETENEAVSRGAA